MQVFLPRFIEGGNVRKCAATCRYHPEGGVALKGAQNNVSVLTPRASAQLSARCSVNRYRTTVGNVDFLDFTALVSSNNKSKKPAVRRPKQGQRAFCPRQPAPLERIQVVNPQAVL